MIRKKEMKLILLLISFLIIFLFLNKVFNFTIPCLFHEITNLYCPGCGITRMFLSLFKLDFYQAFRYNPLVFILLILSIVYFLVKKIGKLNFKLPNYIYYYLLFIIYSHHLWHSSKHSFIFFFSSNNFMMF